MSESITLTKTTPVKITLATALIAMAGLIGAGWRANAQISDMATEMKLFQMEMQSQLKEINTKLEAAGSDHWPRKDMASFAQDLAIGNPGMKVPDPRRPGYYIQTGGGNNDGR